jgi:hypothetical protein
MDMHEYLLHYSHFDKQFCPTATVEEVEDKLMEEMQELQWAILQESDTADRIGECIDVMNVSIKLLKRYGVVDVLDAGYMKLELTRRKYLEQAQK